MLTKTRFNTLIKLIRHKLNIWYYHNFNSVVKLQLKNPKQIPIIIISFNQLHYLKQLVDFLLKNDYSHIVIVDNKSTYKPLLDYFEMIKTQVKIYRLEENIGHLSFWKSEVIYKKYSKGYYVVTDADIVPVENCPDDFMDTFRILLDKAYDRTKVGFSLSLDDIPETNPNKERILNWESKFYKTRIHPLAYKAELDTTFALYRPGYNNQLKDFTKAWRTAAPIQAQHGGWYIDPKALTEEQAYYMKTANASASWQINAQGELINTIHQPLYTNED